VTVNWSDTADNVAVDDKSVSKHMVPDVEALNVPILAIVTGNESDPFVVNVFDRVYVFVPLVWAYAPSARSNPPPAVTISAVSVVSPAAAADALAVRAIYAPEAYEPVPLEAWSAITRA
jgi:hypothetical protein